MLSVKYDNFSTFKAFTVNEKNTVECSLNLSEDNYDKILSITGAVYEATFEKEGDVLRFGGLAAFNAVFSGEELMRVEAGAKFNFSTPYPEGQVTVENVAYTIENVRVKKEGGMLYATANVFAAINFIACEDKPFLAETDALTKGGVTKKSAYKPFNATFTVEDEFDVKKIKRVLHSDFDAVIKTVTCGIGEATVEGCAIFSVLMLPFSENGDIIKEKRTIPFKFEIDCDGATEDAVAKAEAYVDKLNLKVYVDDEKETSTVTVKAELRVAGAATASEEVAYVADCYSAAYDLTLTRERVTGHTFCSTRVYDEKVADKVDAAIPPYSRFLKFVGETIRIADVGVGEGFLTFDALIEGDALMTDEDGAMFSQKFRLPIKLRLPSAAGHIGGVKAVVSALTGKMKNGALEAEAYITVKVDEYEAYEHDFIVEASEGENKKDDLPAISVYIGSRGDEAWDVMKSLGASEQDILSFNPDITFPLVGGERILIYRKL